MKALCLSTPQPLLLPYFFVSNSRVGAKNSNRSMAGLSCGQTISHVRESMSEEEIFLWDFRLNDIFPGQTSLSVSLTIASISMHTVGTCIVTVTPVDWVIAFFLVCVSSWMSTEYKITKCK